MHWKMILDMFFDSLSENRFVDFVLYIMTLDEKIKY